MLLVEIVNPRLLRLCSPVVVERVGPKAARCGLLLVIDVHDPGAAHREMVSKGWGGASQGRTSLTLH